MAECVAVETAARDGAPRAVQLQRRLEQVTFEIHNQTALAEGRRPGTVEGGTFQGVEDFLGSSQVGPAKVL